MMQSGKMHTRKTYTFNEFVYMPRRQKAGIISDLRKQAAKAWSEKEGELPGDPPYAFILFTAIDTHIGTRHAGNLQDADASAFLAKRFLDGAIDAKIIPDDGPEWIHSSTVVQCHQLHLPPGFTALYQGIFIPPFIESWWESEPPGVV